VTIATIQDTLGYFPSGKYLEVEANVYEGVTGKEEVASNTDTIFADAPYYFSIARSKLSYHPGIPYNLKVNSFFY